MLWKSLTRLITFKDRKKTIRSFINIIIMNVVHAQYFDIIFLRQVSVLRMTLLNKKKVYSSRVVTWFGGCNQAANQQPVHLWLSMGTLNALFFLRWFSLKTHWWWVCHEIFKQIHFNEAPVLVQHCVCHEKQQETHKLHLAFCHLYPNYLKGHGHVDLCGELLV